MINTTSPNSFPEISKKIISFQKKRFLWLRVWYQMAPPLARLKSDWLWGKVWDSFWDSKMTLPKQKCSQWWCKSLPIPLPTGVISIDLFRKTARSISISDWFISGARGRTRTGKEFTPRDFKSRFYGFPSFVLSITYLPVTRMVMRFMYHNLDVKGHNVYTNNSKRPWLNLD